jgi:TolB-like protein/Tfp pilus assembly protein PilF
VPEILRFGAFEADLAAGRLLKHGVRINLRKQSFEVLASLLESRGNMVTRDDLRRRLWPDAVFVDFDNGLNSAIGRLRAALGDSAERPLYIETLPKYGYRFIAKVSAPAVEPVRPSPPASRIVVLPFLNLSGDAGQDFLSEAMTDEIIGALAELAADSLAVIARTTAMHYRGTHKDVARIARELRVDYVVEGAVRPDAAKMALNVQLIRASDQAHVWAGSYETALGDLFTLRHTIAETIAARLHVPPRKDGASATKKPTDDLEAYTLYLKGRHHLMLQTAQDFAAAKECFERAVALDPRFALAYDALAELHWYLGFVGLAAPTAVAGIGMFYALRALEIDNALAETHALLGIFRLSLPDFDSDDVKRHYERARALNPSSPLVRIRYAIGMLLFERRIEEAIAETEAALESDPLSLFMLAWYGFFLWLDRQYDRAMQQGRLMVEIDPTHYGGYWTSAMYCREKGLFDEAIAAHRRAVELTGGSPLMLGWMGLTLGRAGHVTEAREVLEQLRAAAERTYVPPSSFAWTYLGLRDIDNTFAWLNRAVDACDLMVIPLETFPFLDALRADPRYPVLLRKLKTRTTPLIADPLGPR